MSNIEINSTAYRVGFYLLASIFIMYLIFSPAANLLYYASDDFRYSLGGINKSCKSNDGFYFVWTLGRPLQAYVDCLSYKFSYTLERMRILRLISIALMGCGMGLLAELLSSLGLSLLSALFAAACVFLAPQLYDEAISVGAIPLPLTIVFILLGYKCLNSVYLKTYRPKLWISTSALFIFAALITYPAMAFFFATLILTKVLFSDFSKWPITRIAVMREVMVFLFVCTLYFILAYWNMHFHSKAFIPEAYQLDHPNFNILEILQRVWGLGNIFSDLWSYFPSINMRIQGWTTFAILISGIFFANLALTKTQFYRQDKKNALLQVAEMIAFVFAIFILCSAFYLIIPVRQVTGSRLLYGSISAGVMIMLWCLSRWPKSNWTTFYLALFFCLIGYKTNLFITARSLVYAQYLDSVRQDIYDYLIQGRVLHRIHFIISRPEYPYTRFFLANGALTQQVGYDVYKLKWCSLSRGVAGEEKDHQLELFACLDKLNPDQAGITYSYKDETYTKTNDMLVIDRTLKSINYITQYS